MAGTGGAVNERGSMQTLLNDTNLSLTDEGDGGGDIVSSAEGDLVEIVTFS